MADVAEPTAKAVNKVEINGKAVIDLTQDTVTPKTLKKGVTAHSASGQQITGTAEEDLSLGMTSVAVGDFIRVKSIDENGKPTSWEPVEAEEAETVDVDLLPAVTAEDNGKVLQVVGGSWTPSNLSKGVRWQLIRKFTLEEATTRIVIDTDENGVAVSDYNPVAIKICLDIPADSTQTSTNGSLWVYPVPLNTGLPRIRWRMIAPVNQWKTIARQLCLFMAGDADGIFFSTGNGVSSMIPDVREDYSTYKIMGGVLMYINTSGDHMPVGMIASVSVLSDRA